LLLLCIWLCGFLFVVFRWTRQWAGIRAAMRIASPLPLSPAMDPPLPIRAVSSPMRLEPGVFGVFRPVLMVPEGVADRLTPAQWRAILAHELCHVDRRDNLTAALHMAVEAIFWFHPLVWWIGKRLMEERERACDEEVVRLGGDPQAYGEAILGVCKFYLESPLVCVAGVTGADLKRRLREIMMRRITPKLGFGRKSLLAAAGFAAVAAPVTVGALKIGIGPSPLEAQSVRMAANASPGLALTTIKPSEPGGPKRVLTMSGQDILTDDARLSDLIMFAYDIHTNQIKRGPAWLESDKYDVSVRPDIPGLPDIAQMRVLFQKLLADRFQLKFHREKEELSVYALTVAKTGAKITKSQADPEQNFLPGMSFGPVPSGTSFNVTNSTLAEFVTTLHGFLLDKPAVDQTGLSGRYDFTLTFTPDAAQAARLGDVGGRPLPAGDILNAAPDLFTAFQQQLGLKLESTKAPVDVLVVDHVERPSAN
jgi:bla regulator protein blaR1